MNENQDIKSDKFINLPILTPEEETAIEERELRIASKCTSTDKSETKLQQKDVASVASAILGGGISSPPQNTDTHTPKTAMDSSLSADGEPFITEILSPEELKEHLSKFDEETLDTVLSATDLFKKCLLPDNTELQERMLKTKHDILVGDHAKIEFGLSGADIAVCECTELRGDIIAEGDLRIDNFCEVFGTVICNGDAYIGEGVKIHGKMTIGGNLNISENAHVEKEFHTFGMICIRNPIPVVIYLLIYIFAMLHLNGDKKTEKKLNEFMADVSETPLVLPPKTILNLSYFLVNTPMDIGSNCRLHGNIRAHSIIIKKDTTIFGSISVADKARIGVRDAIHGDIAGKRLKIERGADVLGNLIGETVWLHEDAHVSGIIKADNGLTFGTGTH